MIQRKRATFLSCIWAHQEPQERNKSRSAGSKTNNFYITAFSLSLFLLFVKGIPIFTNNKGNNDRNLAVMKGKDLPEIIKKRKREPK